MVKWVQNTGGPIMSATIVKLLESKNMSVTKVSEISKVPLSTLRNAIVKPINLGQGVAMGFLFDHRHLHLLLTFHS